MNSTEPPVIRQATLEGQIISYTLKRSPRARYLRLEIRPRTGLTVVVPTRYGLHNLPDFLFQKRRWILEKLAKNCNILSSTPRKDLQIGDDILYLGQHIKLTPDSTIDSEVLLVPNGLIINTSAVNGRFPNVVKDWYIGRARDLFAQKIVTYCAVLGVNYSRLTVRGNRTRWGSCSVTGRISLSWRLIMAPEKVIDYVVIHELAHLKEMNHSKRFWSLVALHCPDWREYRTWLKTHEAELIAHF